MFTPVETSIGAILLHQATSVLLFQNGNVLGISGILRRFLTAPSKETVAFMTGLAASILPLKIFVPELATRFPSVPTTLQAALFTVGVGALVGLGTKISNGCTSGHMLCGLSRFSPYSIAAVATFFPVAMLTHHLVHPTLLTEACPGEKPCYVPRYPSSSTTASLVLLAAVTIVAARTVPKLIAKAKAVDEKSSPNTNARVATQALAGLEFGLGLHISQMAHPGKVASFLSFPAMEAWDPSLALVILFGVLPNMIEIHAKGFDKPPSFNDGFLVPKRTVKDIDVKLILGAAAFGIGWGLTGTCPGPAILRAVSQPSWGLLWIGGFWFGGLMGGTS